MNPTGWHANVACTVTDGSSSLHAKLSRNHAEMAKVYDVANLLVSRYRMPPILAWIDLGELVGFAMPSIPNQPATEELIPRVIELADLLHRDAELAGALPEDEQL